MNYVPNQNGKVQEDTPAVNTTLRVQLYVIQNDPPYFSSSLKISHSSVTLKNTIESITNRSVG